MSSSIKNEYQSLYSAARKAYPTKKKDILQKEINIWWNDIKENKRNLDDELKRLNNIVMKNQSGLLKLWTSIPEKSTATLTVAKEMVKSEVTEMPSPTPENLSTSVEQTSENKSIRTPVQNMFLNEINEVEKKISDFYIIKNKVGLSKEHESELKSLINSKISLEKKVKTLQVNQASKKKQRNQKKRALEDFKNTNPEEAKKLKMHSKSQFNKCVPLLNRNELVLYSITI